MRFATALLILFTATAAPAQDGKKYALKLKWTPVVGHKSELSENTREGMKMSVSVGERVLNREQRSETKSFRAVEEILEVKGEDAVRKSWTFRKATRKEGEEDVSYGFEGKTVLLTRQEDGTMKYAYSDGTTPTGFEANTLRGIFSQKRKRPEDGPDASNPFAPKSPVAVGESWKPDAAKLMEVLMGDADGVGTDNEKAKAEFTLKAVETRDGAEYARIEGGLDFWVTSMGPLELKKPVPCTLRIELDACRDGKLPDGAMKMTMIMKGLSSMRPPNAQQDLALDMDLQVHGEMRRTTVK